MKYIDKILLLTVVLVFTTLISCEDDDAFVEQKPSVSLISPTDKANGIDIAPSFEWEASDPNGRPLKFDFYMGLDSTKLFLQAENLKVTDYSLTDYKILKDAAYYWKVVAKNGLEEKESDIWEFMSIPAPDAPNLTSPETDIFVRDALTFEWEAVAAGEGETISYKVLLGKTNPPTDVIATVDDGSTSFVADASTLDIGEVYYWQVNATDLINDSSSEVRSFKKLRSGAPDEPLIVAPVDKTGVMSGVVLDWTDVTDPEGDAVSYDVYLDKQNTPATLVATVTTSEFTTSALDANSAYYWYVVAKDSSGNFTESQISGFTVLGAGPGFPAIHEFAVQDVFSLDELLVWDAAAGATSYDVYIDTVNPPVNIVATDITETEYKVKNSEIPSDLTDVKTYYALVVAKDGSGGETNSFPVAFTPQMTGVYTDVRATESIDYNWVRLGTQVWMSQNLRAKKLTDGTDLTKVNQATSADYPITASSTELYYDSHDLPVPGFPDVWAEGDNGRVYSDQVRKSPLIEPEGWHVPKEADISTIQSYIPQAGDLLDEWYGGTDPYGANFVMAGYRYNDFDAGRPAGFRYVVEQGRTTFWINNSGSNNAWEVYPDKYRPFNQTNSHLRMFGIRLVKND